ncbi:hypothetical protein [Pseudomonas yamanorum]|uniref:Uncharacterized protein n=1 Tax=Pseudomonas yamanorum TaxID=515393 RepID=A0A7Y8FIE9_9PSED|nr:hypothetical protein [Pseudomonas yamanorum]NWE79638.1 hypothetical protein [Pseudomonas yamanorum]
MITGSTHSNRHPVGAGLARDAGGSVSLAHRGDTIAASPRLDNSHIEKYSTPYLITPVLGFAITFAIMFNMGLQAQGRKPGVVQGHLTASAGIAAGTH